MGRHKPGKPRRPRPEPTPETHEHAGFEIPADLPDPDGRPVDHGLLGRVMGAAFDGCTTCQDPLLTLLVEDAATTARVVELACISTHAILGGLPPSMTDDGARGTSSPEFRRLARAGVDGENAAMWRECEAMTTTERRAAVNTALDTLIGQLAMGPL